SPDTRKSSEEPVEPLTKPLGTWADTQTYTAVRAWIQQEPPMRVLGRELDRSVGRLSPSSPLSSAFDEATGARRDQRGSSVSSASEFFGLRSADPDGEDQRHAALGASKLRPAPMMS
ncbi:unnamed protein product, partial [Polarella glacialis]